MTRPIRIMVLLAAAAAAIALQYAAFISLLPRANVRDPLPQALLLQVLAAGAEAVALYGCLPRRYREPRVQSLLFLALACMFVPGAGGLVVLFGCMVSNWLAGGRAGAPIGNVVLPGFVSYLVSRMPPGRGAHLHARLSNPCAPAEARLAALVAVQNMELRKTSGMLRDLLSDPLEDIRLIAYGRLDHAENEVMQKIVTASRQLAEAGSDAERHLLSRLLAELNFELVYQNLVQGEVRDYTLRQAEHYASTALGIDVGDSALWVLRGRIALLSGAADDAFLFFDRARNANFPRERLIPWFAEAHFLRGEHGDVESLFKSWGGAIASPALRPAIEYWTL
ncbi:hypothetical protein AQ477_17915 (plasmid) [Burkholderia thailandensis]|nr:hypothetical protein AQ477_17915 [Burkholderia thailandensis]KXF59790.1 hypothetical protein AQ476_18405 [Burkholderia thailandensis]PNE73161.1 hypothetical protein A8H37_13680 [Burkholderia thailandensis]